MPKQTHLCPSGYIRSDMQGKARRRGKNVKIFDINLTDCQNNLHSNMKLQSFWSSPVNKEAGREGGRIKAKNVHGLNNFRLGVGEVCRERERAMLTAELSLSSWSK